jgi:hypothetical protein
MKKKDLLYVVLFVLGLVGIIALVGAWGDGYFDNSFVGNILSTVFPSLFFSYLLFLTVINWSNKIRSLLKTWGVIFLLCVIYMLLPTPIVMDAVLMIVIIALVMLTIIIKCCLKW